MRISPRNIFSGLFASEVDAKNARFQTLKVSFKLILPRLNIFSSEMTGESEASVLARLGSSL